MPGDAARRRRVGQESLRRHTINRGAEALAFDGPCVADYAGRMLRALALAVVVASAAGCDGALLRTLSEDQAGQLCVQKGGWWRADGERGGYCERQSAN